MSCAFCSIIAGDLESSPIAEDDDVVAFADIRPVTTGHLLVIPRAHATGLAELPPETGGAVFRLGQRLAAAARTALGCAGVNLFLADGVAAGQEVFHAHLHVIPRYPDDGFGLYSRPRFPPRPELDAVAARVRDAVTG